MQAQRPRASYLSSNRGATTDCPVCCSSSSSCLGPRPWIRGLPPHPEAIHIIHCWHQDANTAAQREILLVLVCFVRQLVATASSHTHPGRVMTSMTGSCKKPRAGSKRECPPRPPIGVWYPQNATVQADDEGGTGHCTALSHRRPCKSHENGCHQVSAWNVVYDGTCDWLTRDSNNSSASHKT